MEALTKRLTEDISYAYLRSLKISILHTTRSQLVINIYSVFLPFSKIATRASIFYTVMNNFRNLALREEM